MMRVSLHGGHSGQFCDHARDTLADIVAAYRGAGFQCVGLTEHMPPATDAWLYPDEAALGRSALWMQERFAAYVGEARRLAELHGDAMRVLVAMESEWYCGCAEWVGQLRKRFRLDYIVGSVHHVQGICFDFSRGEYERASALCGGLEALYCAYFDAQRDMIDALRPEVVGHFDLIRLHDPQYARTLRCPEVWQRVVRNLETVRATGGILDINARALLKGQPEPYVCAPILDLAAEMGLAVAYGDDAHGVQDVGFGVEEVERTLALRLMRSDVLPV